MRRGSVPRAGNYVASDHRNVGRGKRCAGLQRRNKLRGVRTAAVVVIENLSGGGVVDETVVGVVSARGPRGSEEARISGRKVAVRAERGHHAVVELQAVRATGKVGDAIG